MAKGKREVSPFEGDISEEPIAKRLRRRGTGPSLPVPVARRPLQPSADIVNPVDTTSEGPAPAPSSTTAGQGIDKVDDTESGVGSLSRESNASESRSGLPEDRATDDGREKVSITRGDRAISQDSDGWVNITEGLAPAGSAETPQQQPACFSDEQSSDTTQSLEPDDLEEDWYEPSPYACEDVQDYRPGGLFAITLDAKLDGERYCIIAKLGVGGSCTVWLARDNVEARYVAIKIYSATRTKDGITKELKAYKELKTRLSEADYERLLVPYLRSFLIEHPQAFSLHLCMVFAVTGPSIMGLRGSSCTLRVSPDVSRKIARALAEALQCFHASGLCWGDLIPGNVALQLTNIDDWTREEVYERLGQPETIKVQVLDGCGQQGAMYAPAYLVRPIDFSKHQRWQYFRPEIRCLDFGESTFDADDQTPAHDKKFGIVWSIADPEALFWNTAPVKATDIWAMACIWFELRTGERVFDYYDDDFEFAELECAQIATIGPCPPSFYHQIRRQATRIQGRYQTPVEYEHSYIPPWKARLQARAAATESQRREPRYRLRHIRKQLLRLRRTLCTADGCGPMCARNICERLSTKLPCRCGQCGKSSCPPSNYSGEPYMPDQSGVYKQFPARSQPKTLVAGHRTLQWRLAHIGKVDADQTGETESVARASAEDAELEDATSTTFGDDHVLDEDATGTRAPRIGPLSDEEAKDFEDVLLMMLTWYRRDRASLEDVLAMPWLNPDRTYPRLDTDAVMHNAGADEPWIQPCEPIPRMGNIYEQKESEASTQPMYVTIIPAARAGCPLEEAARRRRMPHVEGEVL